MRPLGSSPQHGGKGERVRERLQLNTANITNKLIMKLVMAVVGDRELLEAAIAEGYLCSGLQCE